MSPLTRLRLFVGAHPLIAALGLLVAVYLTVEHRRLVVGAGLALGLLVLGALVARAASWRSGWAGPTARIRNPDPPPATSWGRDPHDERRTPAPMAVAPAPPVGGPVLIQVGAVSILVPEASASPAPVAAPAAPALPAAATWIREPAGALPAHVREVSDVR